MTDVSSEIFSFFFLYVYIIYFPHFLLSIFVFLYYNYMWGGVFCPMSVFNTSNVIPAEHQFYNHWHSK